MHPSKTTLFFSILLISVLTSCSFAQRAIPADSYDRNILPLIPEDSLEKMNDLKLPEIKNESNNTLFNDCFYCQQENRIWHSSVNDLYSAAYKCGIDFLEARIDQIFYLKSVTVLTRIYLSVFKNRVIIDSLVYVQQDSTRSIKKVLTIVGEKERKNSLTDKNNLADITAKQDYKTLIDSLCEQISDFRSTSLITRTSNKFKYAFYIYNSAFIIDDNQLMQKQLDNHLKQTGSDNYRLYLRLGKFKYGSDCEPEKKTASDIKINLHDHYVYNQCIVDYQISSKSGISQVHLQADNIIDSIIKFNNDKKLSGSFSIGFGTESRVLIVTITDTDGNTAERKLLIFQKLDDYNKKRKKQVALVKSRKEWADKNAINTAVDFVSRFSGNPVTSLLNLYCEGKAEENLLKKPDLFKWDSAFYCKIPYPGRTPLNQSNLQNGIVYDLSINLFARTGKLNGGAFAHFLDSPSLDSTGNPFHYNILMRIPLSDGYHITKWQFNNIIKPVQERSGSVIICREVEVSGNRVTLEGIPYIIDDPLNSLEYRLVIMSSSTNSDSLILTYIIKKLDRSQSTLYRTIFFEYNEISDFSDQRERDLDLQINARQFNHDNERIIVSNEKLNLKDQLLGLYVFVYSVKQKETLGVGCLWMQH